MTTYGWPILFTLALWWGSTIVILYLDGLPRRTYFWSMTGISLLAMGALAGLAIASGDTSVTGAYRAFTCGLILWAWQITSYFMGLTTGPRRTPCDPSCRGWRRFVAAVSTCLYHELGIAVMAVVIVALVRDQPNAFGAWTFIVLWWMHASAKLNLFFGVPNRGEEFIPPHLQYLTSYMATRPMNAFFPFSVSVSTVIAVILAGNAISVTATPFEATGFTMLASLMVLAILEHWLLVTPFDANALWQWGLRTAPDAGPTEPGPPAESSSIMETSCVPDASSQPKRRRVISPA